MVGITGLQYLMVSVGLDTLHQLPHLRPVVGPQPGPGLDGVDPPGDVLQVLRQQVLGPRDDVERLGPIASIANLEILVSDTDETTIVSTEHVRVKKLQQVDQQVAVAVILGKLWRIQTFPQVD